MQKNKGQSLQREGTVKASAWRRDTSWYIGGRRGDVPVTRVDGGRWVVVGVRLKRQVGSR